MTKQWIIQATQDSPSADGSRDIRYYTGANGEYQFLTNKHQTVKFEHEVLARETFHNYQLRRDGYVITVVPVFDGYTINTSCKLSHRCEDAALHGR